MVTAVKTSHILSHEKNDEDKRFSKFPWISKNLRTHIPVCAKGDLFISFDSLSRKLFFPFGTSKSCIIFLIRSYIFILTDSEYHILVFKITVCVIRLHWSVCRCVTLMLSCDTKWCSFCIPFCSNSGHWTAPLLFVHSLLKFVSKHGSLRDLYLDYLPVIPWILQIRLHCRINAKIHIFDIRDRKCFYVKRQTEQNKYFVLHSLYQFHWDP
jgi:hypothetical protein